MSPFWGGGGVLLCGGGLFGVSPGTWIRIHLKSHGTERVASIDVFKDIVGVLGVVRVVDSVLVESTLPAFYERANIDRAVGALERVFRHPSWTGVDSMMLEFGDTRVHARRVSPRVSLVVLSSFEVDEHALRACLDAFIDEGDVSDSAGEGRIAGRGDGERPAVVSSSREAASSTMRSRSAASPKATGSSIGGRGGSDDGTHPRENETIGIYRQSEDASVEGGEHASEAVKAWVMALKRELTRYVGPIAPLLVDEMLEVGTPIGQVVELLSLEIEAPDARAAFVRKVPRLPVDSSGTGS